MRRLLAIAGAVVLLQVVPATGQTFLSADRTVVAPGSSLSLTVVGPPGHWFAIAGSSVNAGLSFAGVPLLLGIDARLIAVAALDGSGQAEITFVPPFAGSHVDRYYVQAVTAPSPALIPPSLSNSVVIQNADIVALPAGGDLGGAFPSPTIASQAGANLVKAINTGSTAIRGSRVALAAGGDLTGTYPNPSIATAAGDHVLAALNNATGQIADARIPSTFATFQYWIDAVAQRDVRLIVHIRKKLMFWPTEADLASALTSIIQLGSPAAGDLTGTFPNPTLAPTAGANLLVALNGASGVIRESLVSASFARTSEVTSDFLKRGGVNSFTGVGLALTSSQTGPFMRFRTRGQLGACTVDRDVFAVHHTGGIAAEGELGCGALSPSLSSTRMLWDPSRAAFRAGTAPLDGSSGAQAGHHSFAVGLSNGAPGLAATALGASNFSGGTESFTAGDGNVAAAAQALALGTGNRSYAARSAAIGAHTFTGAAGSVAIGAATTACASHSMALGSFAATGRALPDDSPPCDESSGAGSFVWADRSTGDVFASTAPNQFSVRGAGGVRFVTSSTEDAGVMLAPASHAWSIISDARAKTLFVELDGDDVLRKLSRTPVRAWSYRTSVGVRHVGPTAQDFRLAFGLGSDALAISTIDPVGVALRATQALDERTRELTALRRELEALRAEFEALAATIREKYGRTQEKTP